MTIQSINPYNGKTVFENKRFTTKQVQYAIDDAHSAFLKWKNITLADKAIFIDQLGKILLANKEEWGEVMTLEMGKPITQSIAEIEKCAWVCSYYAENAIQQLAPRYIKTDAKQSYIRYDPIGIILGVMPWNYPFWQVFRFAIPTIMAGNTVLLKHASNVMESAKCIAKAFEKAKIPKGVFTNLPIESAKVEAIIRNPKVKGVSLTGSKPAGAAVAAIAASEIKPSLLELGGNNALVVFEDCNFEKTLNICLNARFQNTGQSCIAGKRLLVQESIADEFLTALQMKIEHLKSGNPLHKDTFIGTMVHANAAKELYEQLQDALQKGACLVTGGSYDNAYFSPTLVKNVNPEMRVFHEETFGPLLTCTTFKDDAAALALVNASEFGLGVSLFTNDQKRIEKLIPLLDEGAVFINELVKSDPRLPFGGIKISGYGRELAEEGIMAFVNKKVVYAQ